MSFIFISSIPTASSIPSQDQNTLRTNAQSIQGLIAVDHVGFNAAVNTGGRHNQVTYNALQNPATPTDPVCILFPKNDSFNHPNQFFINSQGTFLLSCVKAFGSFVCTSGNANISPINSFNISTTIAKPGPGQVTYVVTLTGNAVTGNNVVVLANSSSASTAIGYSFSSGILTLIADASSIVSFVILQA